jgi:hypothetical protein
MLTLILLKDDVFGPHSGAAIDNISKSISPGIETREISISLVIGLLLLLEVRKLARGILCREDVKGS